MGIAGNKSKWCGQLADHCWLRGRRPLDDASEPRHRQTLVRVSQPFRFVHVAVLGS